MNLRCGGVVQIKPTSDQQARVSLLSLFHNPDMAKRVVFGMRPHDGDRVPRFAPLFQSVSESSLNDDIPVSVNVAENGYERFECALFGRCRFKGYRLRLCCVLTHLVSLTRPR